MSEQARTPGVSPAELPKEWPACPGCEEKELYCAVIHKGFKHTVDCLLSCYVCATRISYRNLERFRREAQVTALESVAKEMCDMCARPETFPAEVLNTIERAGLRRTYWRHVCGKDAYACHCPEIWDSVSRLRSGEEPGGEPEKKA